MQTAKQSMRRWVRRRFAFPGGVFRASLLLVPLILATCWPQSIAQVGSPGGAIGSGQGPRGAGMGAWLPGARGVFGTVTAANTSSFTIRLDNGSTYAIQFSANTRILQQPARPSRVAQREGEPPQMQSIQASAIHPGYAITAIGEVDDIAKSVGAVAIVRLDPQRAAELKTMEANYEKTWLAGSVTAIQGTQITILGMVDRVPHDVSVDENTSFRRLRESITLADLQPGEEIRIAGAAKGKTFVATEIRVMPSRRRNGPGRSAAGPNTGPNTGLAAGPPR